MAWPFAEGWGPEHRQMEAEQGEEGSRVRGQEWGERML